MPRNAGNVYSKPPGTTPIVNDDVDPVPFNLLMDDIATDLNTPRPIVAGGTGASSASAALVNLGLTATAAEINTLDGITASTAELNILDGVTATTAEINALDGVTATGTALIVAADEAAGRAAIDAPAIPTASTGPGNFVTISPATGADAVLPSGGTWAYKVYRFTGTGALSGSACGVAAGGTTIAAGVASQTYDGFAWRYE